MQPRFPTFAQAKNELGNRTIFSRFVGFFYVISGGLLFASIGIAAAWRIEYILLGSAAFALSTWLARSISRALICFVASIGLLSVMISSISGFASAAVTIIRLELSWIAIVFWLVVVGLAGGQRRIKVARDYGLPELVGCWMGIVIASLIAIKIDYATDLTYLLVHVEDNEAWVGLTTGISAHSWYVGGGVLGPVMNMFMGLLLEFQTSGTPIHNSTFSAYALAIVLTPSMVATLFRQRTLQSSIVFSVFMVLATFWAYYLPFTLFSNNGHLTAIWAFLFFLVLMSVLSFGDAKAWNVAVAVGVALAFGTVWFPVVPLAGLALGYLAILMWRESGRKGRIAVAVVSVIAIRGLIQQLGMVTGATANFTVERVHDGLASVYSSQGGTATLDNILLIGVLAALVSTAVVVDRADLPARALWYFLIVSCIFVALVYSGGSLLQTSSGYGPPKLLFVIGFGVTVGVIGVIARISLNRRVTVAIFTVLLLGSIIFGGTSPFLSMSWPGHGTQTVWLKPLQKVVATTKGASIRPVGCFSNDPWQAYFCSRWGAGLSDSSQFNYYRLAVVNAWDPAAEVKWLREHHLLSGSDVVFLDVPDGAHVWGWTLLRNAGRVFDVEGKQVDLQNPEVRWTLQQSKRWMGPAKELTERLKVSMPSGPFSEVICFSNDVAESIDCSSFVTAELGKQSSELITGLASGSPQDAVKAASSKGLLDHVVVLALDMPAEGAMLPWERTFFKNVARVYGVTKSGGIKVLTPR